jgi:hypothetical protein
VERDGEAVDIVKHDMKAKCTPLTIQTRGKFLKQRFFCRAKINFIDFRFKMVWGSND